MTNKKLTFTLKSLEMSEFGVVVEKCGTLFENAFKEIYHQAITALPFEARNAVLQAEKQRSLI